MDDVTDDEASDLGSGTANDGRPSHRLASTSRRSFLWGVGGASVVLLGVANRDDVRQIDPELVGNLSLPYAFDIVRAQDALVLKVKAYNMQLVTSSSAAPFLTAIDSSAPRYLVVEFPDQSVGEESVTLAAQANTANYDFNPPTDSNGYRAHAFDRVQPTRLVFEVTGDLNPSLQSGSAREGLLDWDVFTPQLDPGIVDSSTPGPTAFQTSIGAPFGMALSPTSNCGWIHSTQAVADLDSNITPIWHTRLGALVSSSNYAEYPDAAPQVTAVLSNNFKITTDFGGILTDTNSIQVPMDPGERAAIVMLTTDYKDYPAPNPPLPVDVHRLMLTSNGAWLDLHGSWPIHTFNPVVGWTQRSTHGRDHEVVVSKVGYLLPFGHPVTLVTRNVRRFEATSAFSTTPGPPVANIRQNEFLVIRKQDRYFDATTDPNLPNGGRGFPFARVRLNVTTTPNLTFERLNLANSSQICSGVAFCLADQVPYQFDVTAWDWEGNKHHFSLPMAFVTEEGATSNNTSNGGVGGDVGVERGSPTLIQQAYNAYSDPSATPSMLSMVSAAFFNQSVALAASAKSGDTTVRVDQMTFSLSPVPSSWNTAVTDEPHMFPLMQGATARIPAVQTVSAGASTPIAYYQPFVDSGFGESNAGQVFLTVHGQELTFSKGGNGTHPGVVTPNISVNAMSRNRGVVGGDVDKYAGGHFDPTGFFSDAKLLGGLLLESIIAPGQLDTAPLLDTLRSFPVVGGVPDLTQPPTLTTTVSWTPTLQDQGTTNPVFVQRSGGATLKLTATIVATPGGAPPSTDVSGDLKNFTIRLFGTDEPFLILDFDQFSFHARNGAKPTVKPAISNVSFGGPLSFINALEQFLPSGPGGNGISVTPTGVTASTSIAIPSVGVGVFNLTNLSFNAAVDVPFTGDPAKVRFSFCTPEKPFLISVLIFGGSGYVALALGTNGMERLEAAFEFGAHMGIDIGIASGSIEVMAGVYFAIQNGSPTEQSTQLTGFVKAHGELNLAVVAVSITFYLSLTYLDQGGHKSAWGEVEVSLDIRVLIFTVSIHFDVRKEFAGGGDPNFSDMYTAPQWSQYAAAYA